ncbi:peptidoglycan-binding domain-containing protein [Streptomyces lutosisoli]|uniref:Peptidoglycan-binding protein n=1 Tax=Streptomyces lutosisoli TaxID=2665721 RepID=A0ABW2VRD9_9ACTN
MGSRMKRVRLGTCTVGALAATALALSTSPAAASGTYSGRAYVYGGSVFSDDWGDEGIVSLSSHTYSNATCLWQKILYADGYLPASEIDGIFGGTTETATENWQTHWTVTPDGAAGKDTWTMAGKGLNDSDGDGAVDQFLGLSHTITITRDSAGRYNFYDGAGNARLAGYDYRVL